LASGQRTIQVIGPQQRQGARAPSRLLDHKLGGIPHARALCLLTVNALGTII